jgi:hypothetical protein
MASSPEQVVAAPPLTFAIRSQFFATDTNASEHNAIGMPVAQTDYGRANFGGVDERNES